MAVETVSMPQLGESVTEGTVVQWLKQEGESIGRDESLLEVETEKVTVEVPSPFQGTVRRILVPAGETVAVGTRLAELETAAGASAPSAASPVTSTVAAGAPVARTEAPAEPPLSPSEAPRSDNRWYSPVVVRLAQEHNLDLSRIEGTGEGGRVTRKDVLAVIQQQREEPAQPAAAPATSQVPAPPAQPVASARTEERVEGEESIVRLSATRRTIAQRMAESAQTIPHAWMMIEVDVTPLVRFREASKESFREREGVDLTYLPFIIKATVEALRENSMMNASWSDEGIVRKRDINVGVAVATDEGLIVPVIKNADGKSIAGIARDLSDLVARSRSRKLRVDDVQGGTFTVDNTGAFGSIVSVPIINPPQAGILTSEAIVKRPVVIDDAIAIRSMMNMCLSFDHRVVDGADVGRFMQSVKHRLEGYGIDTSLY